MRSRWKNSYVSPSLYKYIVYGLKKESFLDSEKLSSLSSRSTTILPFFLHKILWLSDGKKYRSLYINHDMLGHKVGEYISTRIRCVYKRKKKKKKKKQKQKQTQKNDSFFMSTKKKVFKSILLNRKIDTPFISSSFWLYKGLYSYTLKKDYYICSFSSFLLDHNQFDSCRKVASRILKRQKPKGFLFPCVRFLLPYTSKSKNARMGKGKGSFSKFVFRLNCFSPFFFLHNVSFACALRILDQIEYKLPISLCLLSVQEFHSHDDFFFSFLNSRIGSFSCFFFSSIGAIRFL